ncbi:hypothetical protein A2U01_0020943 [Trifolium medium]|uniref:Uncharacterized protein n=1 Tax=Trifolium medium TaxID=97028 RepID=A0A392NLD1_9FABA|nr:hypothetical protein [Trifolium medium]
MTSAVVLGSQSKYKGPSFWNEKFDFDAFMNKTFSFEENVVTLRRMGPSQVGNFGMAYELQVKELTAEKDAWEKEKKNHDIEVYNLKVDQAAYFHEGLELAAAEVKCLFPDLDWAILERASSEKEVKDRVLV